MRTHLICKFVAFTAWAATASAVTSPEAKCQAGKNHESGKYAFCLHKAEARLLKTKGSCSVTTTTACYRDDECTISETCVKDMTMYNDAVIRCEGKYAAKWNTLEQRASLVSATCPDGLLQADVKQVIDECVSNVTSGLAGEGLPDCTGDLATCTTDLGTCDSSLGTCNTNLTSTQESLTTCNTNLGTCNSSLSTCNSSHVTCTGSLTTCNNMLIACQNDLNGCQNPTCGDNSADLGEQCDGGDLDGATCTSLGFTGGVLACGSCAYDTSGCTLPLDACGDGDIDAGEDCDGTNLNGGTCVGEGFGGGTLGCGASCAYNTSGCYATRFVDNGNGTISDYETGLMWEKKSDDGSIHDKDNSYTWSTGVPWNPNGTVYTFFLGTLNSGAGFATHKDWRLPTREELHGIVDYADSTSPTVYQAFHASCSSSCTVTTCSCTKLFLYWSSSTLAVDPIAAYVVDFTNPRTLGGYKNDNYSVRAVRTGL